MNSTTNEMDVIIQLDREWTKKLKAKDIDWIAGLLAKDGRQFPPGAEPVVGSRAIRTAWEAIANTEGLEVSWEPAEAKVSAEQE